MSIENFTSSDVNADYFQSVLPFSVVLGLLSAVGTFGNAFVLYVYAFKYPVCNFKYFVLVLGAIDLLSCLLTIPGEIYTQYTWFTMPSVELCKAKSFLNVATVSCSSIVLLLISIDRYRKVCCPHDWQIKPRCALRLSVAMSIITFLWASLGYIFCGPQTYVMDYKGRNVTVTICLKDDEYKNTIWPPLVMKAGYVGPISLIMMATVALYTLIARVIFKRTAQSTSTQKFTTISGVIDRRKKHNVNETVETMNEPSILDSEFVPVYQNAKNGTHKSGENSLSPDNTLDRNSGKDDILLAVPKIEHRSPISYSSRIRRRSPVSKHYGSVLRRTSHARVRRKTLIMFILTAFFVITTSVYFSMASQMSDKGAFFKDMHLWQEIIVMFFYRLYYFNSLINSIVYGILDQRFRRALRRASRRMSRSMTSITSIVKSR